MEIFKDGKYIIGFLVGVIISFVVMGYVQKNQEGVSLLKKDNSSENGQITGNQEVGSDKKDVVSSDNGEKMGETTTKTVVSQNNKEMRPEDPHSPELQRLDLILREAGRMVDRIETGVKEVKNQQTATVSN